MTRSSILARASKRAVRPGFWTMPEHHGQHRWPCRACLDYRLSCVVTNAVESVGEEARRIIAKHLTPSPEAP